MLRQTVVAVNEATGGTVTLTGRLTEVWQLLLLVTVSVTLYVPTEEYKWQGLLMLGILLGPDAGSLKFQLRPEITSGGAMEERS